MKRSEVDRLGERLRHAQRAEDIQLLDAYRSGFQRSYDQVALRIRSEFGVALSGRPAKSTQAILGKLQRSSSMRLSQMQDIAGCRLVVEDIAGQDDLRARLEKSYAVTLFDRRAKPSFGYRAVHLIVRDFECPVEVQIRTSLQHAWAALSEKAADVFGSGVKYGGGPTLLRDAINEISMEIANFASDGANPSYADSARLSLKQALHDRIASEVARLGVQS